MPSLWHLAACTTRLSNVQSYLISYLTCVTELLHMSLPLPLHLWLHHPCLNSVTH